MNREPAVLIGAIAALIVALAGIFDVVIEVGTVETILLALVPLVSGVMTRQRVIPVSKAPLNA